jgi:hypothetical protein
VILYSGWLAQVQGFTFSHDKTTVRECRAVRRGESQGGCFRMGKYCEHRVFVLALFAVACLLVILVQMQALLFSVLLSPTWILRTKDSS